MTLSVPFAGESVFVPGYGGECLPRRREGRLRKRRALLTTAPTPDKLLPLAEYKPLAKGDPLSSDLSTELQYARTFGSPHFVAWLKEHVQRLHKPPYEGWEVLNTAGNTDGVDGVLRSLFDKGDTLLMEEYGEY